MRAWIFLLFVCCWMPFVTLAETGEKDVRFYGKNPAYSGFNLVFARYVNFIIPHAEPLVTLAIGDDGEFDFSFPLSEEVHAFVDLGRYRASIFIEPGMSYQLVFPPFEPKSQSERLNPFFQPEEVLLGIANEEARGLNRNMIEFDAMFDFYFSHYATDLFIHGNTDRATEIEQMLEERFVFEHSVFKRHKEISYMKLWHMTIRRQDRNLIYKYMAGKPVEYNLPVFWDVFNTIFKGFIPDKLADEVQQPLLQSMTRREPFERMVDIVVMDTLFTNREFAEVLLLYGLYEAYYQQNMAPDAVLEITENAIETASASQTRELASQYHRKLNMLRPGTDAPDFSLINQVGEHKGLSDFKGKFVYLNFIHTANYSALRDLQSMVRLHEIFKEQLHIVTIVVDEEYDAMIRFLDRHPSYNWEFLHFASSPAVLFNYNIMAVPAYYLINPEGQLSLSPAPSPDEQFRERFADRYRSWQREQLRRNPPERRSVFR